MYAHGRGRVVMRAQVAFEETRSDRMAIIVTELPYQVNKAALLEKIADLVKDKRIEGIADLRDESDRDGMRIYIEIKRDANPHKVLNNLFKHTPMQLAFNMNMLALVDGQPQTLPLKAVLQHYIDYRRDVVRRRTEFDLEKARARAHILEGLKIALDNLDAVIKTIRESADVDVARANLMARFDLSEIQAQAILDMRLARLAALERKKIEDEYLAVIQLIAELEDILANPARVLQIIKDELAELKRKYAGERRTRVEDSASPRDDRRGPHRRRGRRHHDLRPRLHQAPAGRDLPAPAPRRQGDHRPRHPRGGRGRAPARRQHPRLGPVLHQPRPRVQRQGPPDPRRQPPGQGHPDHQPARRPGRVGRGARWPRSPCPTSSAGRFLVLATRRGIVKKTPLEQFEKVRSSGIIAITLDRRRRARLGRRRVGQRRHHHRHGARQDRPLPRDRGPADGPPGRRRHRHPARPQGRLGHLDERRPARRRPARADRDRLRQARAR